MIVKRMFLFVLGAILLVPAFLTGCGGTVVDTSFSPVGTLDITFSSDGIVVNDGAAHGYDDAYDMTVDSNGKILTTGYIRNASGNNDMVIWRYNSDGTLDTSFSSDGIVVNDSAAGGGSHDFGSAIITDSSGKILVAGYSWNASGNYDMVIWRYNTDGTLDTSFSSDGIVVSDGAAGGSVGDYGNAITIDSSGRILVTGYSYNAAGNADMVLWRYNTDGTLDTSFSSDGIVVSDNAAGSGDDRGSAVVIDSSGKILVAGYSYNAAGNADMALWRYNTDGTLDTSFSSDGIVVSDNAAGGSGADSAYYLTTDSSGRILVTGYSWNASGNCDMVIWRYNSDGILDTSFSSDGIVVSDNAAGGGRDDRGFAIAIDSSGRILVAGYSWNASGNYDMVIWRYKSDGTLDTSFSSDGIVVSDNAAGGSGDDRGSAVVIDSSGKILVAGYSTNASDNYDMVIWRYE